MSVTITLGVTDLEQTLSFYREVLHLDIEYHKIRPAMPPLLVLRQGESTLLFRELSTLKALHPAVFESIERHPRGLGITFEFEIPNLAAISRELERRQRHVLYELQDDESGWQELWLHDPDGYLLILSQSPNATTTCGNTAKP